MIPLKTVEGVAALILVSVGVAFALSWPFALIAAGLLLILDLAT